MLKNFGVIEKKVKMKKIFHNNYIRGEKVESKRKISVISNNLLQFYYFTFQTEIKINFNLFKHFLSLK